MAFIQTRLSPMVGRDSAHRVATQYVGRRFAAGASPGNADWAIARRRYGEVWAVDARHARRTDGRDLRERPASQLPVPGLERLPRFRAKLGYRAQRIRLVQLVRTYRFGATTVTRPIYHPVASTLTLTGRRCRNRARLTSDWAVRSEHRGRRGQPLAVKFPVRCARAVRSRRHRIVLPHRESRR